MINHSHLPPTDTCIDWIISTIVTSSGSPNNALPLFPKDDIAYIRRLIERFYQTKSATNLEIIEAFEQQQINTKGASIISAAGYNLDSIRSLCKQSLEAEQKLSESDIRKDLIIIIKPLMTIEKGMYRLKYSKKDSTGETTYDKILRKLCKNKTKEKATKKRITKILVDLDFVAGRSKTTRWLEIPVGEFDKIYENIANEE